MFETGECFFRFRARRPEGGLTVPLQLQMLSSEHLPLAKCETLPSSPLVDRPFVAFRSLNKTYRPIAGSW